MSPYQHGEVFVTHDGAETDLDVGHYERFTGSAFSALSNVTSGQIYETVIERERQGGYLGATVQVIPHVTDEIKRRVIAVADDGADVVIIEIGGTVGDIEGQPFLEAARQFRLDAGPTRVCFLHLTLVPMIATAGEYKTKPTQHSVRELRAIGIQPDVLLCRARREAARRRKGQDRFAHLGRARRRLYRRGRTLRVRSPPEPGGRGGGQPRPRTFPPPFADTGADRLERSGGASRGGDARCPDRGGGQVRRTRGLVQEPQRSPWCTEESRMPPGWKSTGLEAESLQNGDLSSLDNCDGVLVPGGFGSRGTEGMAAAAGRARIEGVPFFGICYGFQWAVVEFARSECGLAGASTQELDPDAEHQVFQLLRGLEGVEQMGGTMRVGAATCILREGSLAARAYGATRISERHRHRYEFERGYTDLVESRGMKFTGLTEDGFYEIAEIPDHPWFLAVQFHPEFQSNPLRPHPLFSDFIAAALRNREQRVAKDLPAVAAAAAIG